MKVKAKKICVALVKFKADFKDFEQGLQDWKEAEDAQVQAEVQSWTLVRGRYINTIYKAA